LKNGDLSIKDIRRNNWGFIGSTLVSLGNARLPVRQGVQEVIIKDMVGI